ncbi:DEAD/DEAH box helicase [Breoghania sp. L-A4]|uniref:DEAD/DEAH box helicase n=1 Tax=Breoghania sp. L-A4 TaxID=2304600 RepID=UPI000E35A11B|nr:DEAD/DEAH box helicase [Breoghania sp. L-A4]AXS40520.1 DEAD/DEAH box helicase [Breoghania sp. L-A4]
MSFSTLGLSDKVQKAVEASGYTEPTAIQAEAIPHVLERRDVLGIAQTGTGKTASFTLPMLTILEKGRARARMPRTLILEPTRELAAQVEDNFNKYGVNHKLTVALLIGGVSFNEQDKKIDRGADVLIATPGRLIDHFERGKLLLQGVEILVIDEADRMLDMGFIPDIERICKLLPFTRQTLFFSATMPNEITRLTEQFLHNPVRVEVARAASTSDNVKQLLAATGGDAKDKRETLRSLITSDTDLKNAIIFCNRKRDVSVVAKSLKKHGFNAGELHGDMDQRSRTETLDSFRNGSLALLVASDVAARGLDIPAVSHVFNYDVPIHAEDYVHRIGRTGRAGLTGTAITLATPSCGRYTDAIEKLIGKSIPWMDKPAEFAAAADGERKPRRRSRRKPEDVAEAKTESVESAAPAPEAAEPAKAEQDEAHQEPRKPSSRRSGARKPKSADAAVSKVPDAQTHTPRQAAPQDQQTPPASNRHEPSAAKGKKPPRRQKDHDEPVVGLGDHVPAFLLREVRPKRATR